LPDEVLLNIFSFVPPQAQLSLVCKHWNEVNNDDWLWKMHSEKLGFILRRTDFYAVNQEPFLLNVLRNKKRAFCTLNFNVDAAAIQASPDKRWVARPQNGGRHLEILTYPSSNSKLIRSPVSIERLKMSADGEKILAFGQIFDEPIGNKGIALWNKSGQFLQMQRAIVITSKDPHFNQSISPHLNKYFSWSSRQKGSFSIYDIAQSKIIYLKFPLCFEDYYLISTAFSYDDKWLACYFFSNDHYYRNFLEIWDIETQKQVVSWEMIDHKLPKALTFSKKGDLLAIAFRDLEGIPYVKIYNRNKPDSECIVITDTEKAFNIDSLEFLSNDRTILVVTANEIYDGADEIKNYKLWNIETKQMIYSYSGSFTANGRIQIDKEEEGERELFTYLPHSSSALDRIRQFISNNNNNLIRWGF
jgi:WD40 repeat protein